MSIPRTAYLRWAAAQLGTAEVPLGSNRQPYARLAGHRNGLPWCATFLVAGAKVTGLALPPGADTASTAAMAAAFQRADRFGTIPRPGSFAFVYFPGLGRIAHVGLVWRVDRGWIYTIEGNSNDDGSREGLRVVRRIRQATTLPGRVGVVGYGHPVYLTTPKPAQVKLHPGDTLTGIAERYRVDIDRLRTLNPHLFDGAHHHGNRVMSGETVRLR